MMRGQTLLHIETDISAPVAGLPICSIPVKAEANASLIAAAPDLLAACKAVAGVFQDSEDMPLYARKCIAAVAKAENA